TFGIAVAPIFPPYFALQAVCAVIALATAFGWQKQHPVVRVHRWRVIVLLLATLAVLAGWPVAGKVSELRVSHDSPGDAKAAFATWHLISLLLNMRAVGLAGAAVVLTSALPERRPANPNAQP